MKKRENNFERNRHVESKLDLREPENSPQEKSGNINSDIIEVLEFGLSIVKKI